MRRPHPVFLGNVSQMNHPRMNLIIDFFIFVFSPFNVFRSLPNAGILKNIEDRFSSAAYKFSKDSCGREAFRMPQQGQDGPGAWIGDKSWDDLHFRPTSKDTGTSTDPYSTRLRMCGGPQKAQNVSIFENSSQICDVCCNR